MTRPSWVAPQAWLSFNELDKAVVLVWLDWLVFCDYGFSVSALWCPLATPTIWLGFLLSWTWGISSWLLQQSAATAPDLGGSSTYLAAPYLGGSATKNIRNSKHLKIICWCGFTRLITTSWVSFAISDILPCRVNMTLSMVSIQSLSLVQFFVIPWNAACQASLYITNSWSLLKLTPIESVMPSNRLILCLPLLLLPSIFPRIRVFSNESALHIKWPKYWSFSISPSNEYSGLISFRIE